MSLKVRHISLITGLVLLVIASCSQPPLTGPTVGLDQQFDLKANQAASIEGEPIKVHFVSVPSDTRCPVEEVCVSGQGDAIVSIEVMPDGGSTKSFDLHTAASQTVTFDAYTIALIQLAPWPQTKDPIPQTNYTATLRVTK